MSPSEPNISEWIPLRWVINWYCSWWPWISDTWRQLRSQLCLLTSLMIVFGDGSRTSATHATYIIHVDDTGCDQYEELLEEEVDGEVPHQLPPEIVSRPKWSLYMHFLTFQIFYRCLIGAGRARPQRRQRWRLGWTEGFWSAKCSGSHSHWHTHSAPDHHPRSMQTRTQAVGAIHLSAGCPCWAYWVGVAGTPWWHLGLTERSWCWSSGSWGRLICSIGVESGRSLKYYEDNFTQRS